jgi:hypothetical protein
LAVSEEVSSASPLRLIQQSAPHVSSPELTPSVATYQNYIREGQLKYFDAIECATDPKVFIHPCPGDPGSTPCLKYGIRYRRLSTVVFCDNCILAGTNGDCYDRYLIRIFEMKQSIRIIEQCLDNMPFGPIKTTDNKITPPSRFDIKQSIESLIHHFKFYTSGINIPANETYTGTEAIHLTQ